MDEILKSIRVDLRRSMNGDVSKNMRDKGLDYKINFGIDVIRLRTLAKRHQPNAELAELLWKQQPRELKIMATLLYPPSEFSIENAHKWIREIPTHEIREHLCMNLLQNLDYADNLVANWILSENEELRISGFWLVSRLVISKSACVDILDYSLVIDSAIKELHDKVKSRQPVRLLGVSVSKLVLAGEKTNSLFTDHKRERQTAVLDELKNRFGEAIIHKGK